MGDLFVALFYLAIPIGLLALGFFFGRHNEAKHYEDIERRESNTPASWSPI